MRAQALTLLVFTMTLAVVPNSLRAQSPTPIVVQAATTTAATTATAIPVAKDSEANQVAVRMLQQMKAVNEDLLKKQEATLQRLDEIQKAAEQLKIFSKRG
jgi:mRNA-degrading endonuclease toxin of MazEF toxin-antitoxin module